MALKVLVADDSSFFQRRLEKMVNEHPEMRVVGIAANGREAVDMAMRCWPDVIIMDFEMPVMDGVAAVREIMAKRPVPILMFSSLTYKGARITLDALEAGAVDFMSKDFTEVSHRYEDIRKKLHQRLTEVGQAHLFSSARQRANSSVSSQKLLSSQQPLSPNNIPAGPRTLASTAPPRSNEASLKGRVRLVAIGASTGGPVALAEVLKRLPGNFPVPIVLIQHMPENFTLAFAERLNKLCNLTVRQAENGDRLQPGVALLAPGGKQMIVDNQGQGVRILLGDDRVTYRPSVDVTFASVAQVYGRGALGVVLTGMGSDGLEGSRMLKKKSAVVWSQDEDSCVIYGMPMAVARDNLSDRVLPLAEIGSSLIREL